MRLAPEHVHYVTVFDADGTDHDVHHRDADTDTLYARLEAVESMIATDGGEDYHRSERALLRSELRRRNMEEAP